MGYQIQMRGAGRQPDTTPPASSYDLAQKVRAAIAVGVFVAVMLLVIGYVIFSLATLVKIPPPWQVWLGWLVVCGVVGVLVTCWHGIAWVVRVAVRAWAVDDDERKYRRGLAKEERERQEAAAEKAKDDVIHGDDHDGVPETLTLGQRLDLVALEMLTRAYLDGGAPSREAMEKEGTCTQGEWNAVNKLMKATGLRQKQTWREMTFQEAWLYWRENVKVEEGYAWVLRSSGDWKALERVA